MLAELVDHVIGIDPDRDWITAAIVNANTTGVIATAKFTANNDGYDEAVVWVDTHTTGGDRSWIVEGSGSYGRGLTAALSRAGEWVIEFDRPHQRPTKDGAKTNAPSPRRRFRRGGFLRLVIGHSGDLLVVIVWAVCARLRTFPPRRPSDPVAR